MAETTVTLRLTTDNAGALAGVRVVKNELGGLGTEGNKAGTQVAAGMQRASRGTESFAAQIHAARRQVLGFAGAFVSIQGVRQLAALADQASNIRAQLQLASGSAEAYTRAQEGVFAISQRTSTALASTADLYARITRSVAEYGVSQERVLALTETINQTFAVSGTAAAAQANAITQLTQAFAGGVLRAEEFNSVIENSPRLAQALADGLGVGIGRLRQMVNEGEVTVDRMVAALESQAAVVEQEFSTMPLTIERAWTQVGNAILQYVGGADDAVGASGALAGALSALAGAIGPVLTAGTALAVVMGTNYVVSLAASIAAGIAQQRQAVATAAAELREAKAAEAAALARMNKARISGVATGAEAAYAAAVARTTAAQQASTAAAAASATGLAAFGRSVLALAGGPIGIAVAAVGGLALVIKSVIDAEVERQEEFRAGLTATADMAARMDDLTRSMQNGQASSAALSDHLAELTAGFTALAEARQREAQAEKAVLEARLMAIANSRMGVVSEQELQSASAAARQELERQRAAVAALAASMNDASHAVLQQFVPALDAAATGAADRLGAINSIGDAFTAVRESIALFRNAWGGVVEADRQAVEAEAQLAAALAESAAAREKAGKSAVQLAEAQVQSAVAAAEAANWDEARIDTLREQGAALVANIAATEKAEKASGRRATALGRETAAQRAMAAATKEAHRAVSAAVKAEEALHRMLQEQAAQLGGPVAEAALRYSDELASIAAMEEALLALGPMTISDVEAIAQARSNAAKKHEAELEGIAEGYGDVTDEAQELENVLSRFDNFGFGGLVKDIALVRAELAKATDPKQVARMQNALVQMNAELQIGTLEGFKAVLGTVQAFQDEGSKGFSVMEKGMAALSIVQDLIALKAAVSAVLTQGQGDPYSAWARMAAMAAAVAPYIASIGLTLSSFGGGGAPSPSSAQARQERQGTGTVLGDADARSESIANAVEITAEATRQLVGINRGMLNALRAMQAGISGAAASIARIDFGELDLGSGFRAPGDPLGSAILGSIFGGDQDLIDQGVIIRGGSFGSVSRDPRASSYQTIETDGGWFSSDDIDDVLEPLGEAATNQIRLILTSIGDAVREGALALGLDLDAINAAIEAFRVESIRISTMDLTGEEAQRELEAVFSAIFDDLAGAVVPFIAQFQRVGEGLGETLVRVATSVQVVQEGMSRLGLAIDSTDPERVAQISVALIEAVGGIDQFIEGMSAFVDAFAPEAHKFELLQSDLTRALEQVGLTVPGTREEMWELMQSLDASTEAGRAQIATLLRLTGVADAYYDVLEGRADDLSDQLAIAARPGQILDEARRTLNPLSQRDQRLEDVNRQFDDWRDEMAASGASLEQLTDLEGLRTEALEQAAQAIDDDINRMLGDIGLDLNIDGLSEAEIAQARVNQRFDDYREKLIAMGATEEQLIRLEELRTEALDQASDAIARNTQVTILWRDALASFADSLADRFAALRPDAVRSWINGLAGFSLDEVADQMGLADVTAAVQQRFAAERAAIQTEIAGYQAYLDALPWYAQQERMIYEGKIRQLRELLRLTGDSLGDALGYVEAMFAQRLGNLMDTLRDEFNPLSAEGQVNARFDQLIADATAWGATLEELAEIEEYRQLALQQLHEETWERQMDQARSLRDFLDSLLLDEALSTLTPEQRLSEAQAQYEAALAAAQAGDASAIDSLPEMARRYLEEARGFYSSGELYTSIFDSVVSSVEALADSIELGASAEAPEFYLRETAEAVADAVEALGQQANALPEIGAHTADIAAETRARRADAERQHTAQVGELRRINLELDRIRAEQARMVAEQKRGNDLMRTRVG